MKQILFPFLALIFIFSAGTTGYIIIEKWSFIDAMYMTIITMSTVGYKEVAPLSRNGEIFTIVFIIFSLGIVLYLFVQTGEFIIKYTIRGFFRPLKLERQVKKMKNHYILCGFGRLGKLVSDTLKNERVSFCVLETQDEAIEHLKEEKIPFVQGDAREEENLIKAGVKYAKALAALLPSDADNLYVVFSARELNPELLVIAKAEDELAEKKMLKAGASKVILPYKTGGIRIAQSLLRPTLLEFLDFAIHRDHLSLQVEEFDIHPNSPFVGKTLRDSELRKKWGMIAIAVKKRKEMIYNPDPDLQLNAGDVLVLMGEKKSLDGLKTYAP